MSIDCVFVSATQLRVTVRYYGDEPAADALVDLVPAGGGDPIATTHTDAEGRCTLTDLTPGDYEVVAYAAGHRASRAVAAADFSSTSTQPDAAAPKPQDHTHADDHSHTHEPAEHEYETHPAPSPAGPTNAGAPSWGATEVVAGLALIVALAALTMVIQLQRQVLALQQQLARRDRESRPA